MELAKLVKHFLILLLFSCMLFYAYNSISKFNDKKIAISTFRDFTDISQWMYPSVTICSGFRNASIRPETIAADAVKDGNEDPEILKEEVLRQMTYERQDYIVQMTQAVDDDWTHDDARNDSAWTDEYHEYAGGHCHTWEPSRETKPGEVNSLVIRMKLPPRVWHYKCDENDHSYCWEHLPIYFHPPGGFIFSKAMEFIGRSRVFPERHKKIKLVMTRKIHRRKSMDGDQCLENHTLMDWKKCLQKAYDDQAGCEFPWKASPESSACNMTETHGRFTSHERDLWWDLDRAAANITGCAMPCEFTLYEVERVPFEHEDDHSHDYSVQVYFLEMVTEITEEFEAFDIFSLVGELGGALGLFLGWSCLNLLLDLLSVPLRSLQSHFSREKAEIGK